MRTHRVFAELQPWVSLPQLVRELAVPDRLVAARIEPVTRGREPAAFLDLTFADGERSVTIPLIYVDLAQLDIREVDPLVFPAAYDGLLDDARARALVDRVFADLELRAHRGGFRAEEAIVYGDAGCFARAREGGLFGAAPLARTIPAVAAAVYARRFARDARVLAHGAGAFETAAFVRDIAAHVTVTGDVDETAAIWFGGASGALDPAGYDCAIGEGAPPVRAATVVRRDGRGPGTIVSVASPLPADLMLSFDPADGPEAASFVVATEREPFRRETAAPDGPPQPGGSAGRITLVVRPDAAAAPDADSDEAAALATVLAAAGFTPTVVASIDGLAASAPDLVHLFGVRPGAFARHVAEWTAQRGLPLAVHAYDESPASGGYWGALVAPYCFGYSADDRSVTGYLEMLGRRAVEVDGVSATIAFAPPAAGLDDGDAVLRAADVVFVNSERERDAVERVRPAGVTFVVPPLPIAGAEPEPIGSLVGCEPFVLVHAPIGPLHNQLVVARAAADAGAALVLAGPVEDPVYAERVREFAAGARWIANPAPGTVAALYRSAAVVADAAWVPRGHARLLSAAAAGSAVVSSTARWIDLPLPERWHVDPANAIGVARGIGEALDAANHRDGAVATATAFARERLAVAGITIVAGYAKIASTV